MHEAPPWTDVAPGVSRRLLVDSDSVQMVLYSISRLDGHPVHFHDADQVGFIVHGTGLHRIAGNEVRFATGDSYFVPQGTPHSFEPDTRAGPVVILDLLIGPPERRTEHRVPVVPPGRDERGAPSPVEAEGTGPRPAPRPPAGTG